MFDMTAGDIFLITATVAFLLIMPAVLGVWFYRISRPPSTSEES